MAKPSIFSKSYGQQVKQRRINIFLIILLLIVVGYFGLSRYLNKKDIKMPNIASYFKWENSNEKPNDKTTNNEENKTESDKKQETKVEEKKELSYEYKLSDGNSLKVLYEENNGEKTFKGFKDDKGTISYDISPNKQNIIFEDKASNSIIIGDISGNFKNIDMPSYYSKTADTKLVKENILASNPWYVWSAMPHFISDDRFVYISHLPYIIKDGKLAVWSGKIDGSQYKMAGQLDTSNLSDIKYDGFDDDGRLKILSGSTVYYISPETLNLRK
ncbi:MAG TPA: hypothetical protein DEF85_01060 [Clostridiaceae bacterium]|jgi:hypothetical protein|nr:hypothetical protein [Clostridiaceae bacterium]HBF77034.1 hypothetical protein [Clostridiaceae bacterium]HBG38759.1 hypothetical protein [Clostridiaceae bacterium]HBN28695.1 hypothetical protein [Clostridiaceae bacterium]HBX47478.1 hypothetical protein [Clostridiaceae bacterium]